LGEEIAGQNWAEFLEYGTTSKPVIELQNFGFSRGTSNYLLSKFSKLLSFDNEGRLIDIKEKDLLESLDKHHETYEDVFAVLGPFDDLNM
jgi:hypothetical protein